MWHNGCSPKKVGWPLATNIMQVSLNSLHFIKSISKETLNFKAAFCVSGISYALQIDDIWPDELIRHGDEIIWNGVLFEFDRCYSIHSPETLFGCWLVRDLFCLLRAGGLHRVLGLATWTAYGLVETSWLARSEVRPWLQCGQAIVVPWLPMSLGYQHAYILCTYVHNCIVAVWYAQVCHSSTANQMPKLSFWQLDITNMRWPRWLNLNGLDVATLFKKGSLEVMTGGGEYR